MPKADTDVRMSIMRALYESMGAEAWFAYRHGSVCMYPRNGISKPARWVKQGV